MSEGKVQLLNWLIILADSSLKGTIIITAAILLSKLKRGISSQAKYLLSAVAIISLLILPLSYYLNNHSNSEYESVLKNMKKVPYTINMDIASPSEDNGQTASEASLGSGKTTEKYDAGLKNKIFLSVFYLWFCVLLVLLFRIAVGMLGAHKIIRESEMLVDENLLAIVNEVKLILGVKQNIKIYLSENDYMPITFGIMKPVILLPRNALDWESGLCRSVLMHEIVHIKRRDNLLKLAARLVSTLYWFNPIMWVALKRFYIDMEKACDACVMQLGVKSTDYAGHLLSIAGGYSVPKFFPEPSSAMGSISITESRILTILNKGERYIGSSKKKFFLLASVFLCLAIVLSSVQIVSAKFSRESETLNIITDKKGFVSVQSSDLKINIKNSLKEQIPTLLPVGGKNVEIQNTFGGSIGNDKYKNTGIDIEKGNECMPIIASADGYVKEIGMDGTDGNYIKLEHSNGLHTVYENFIETQVRTGDYVQKGVIIAYTGNIEKVHFEVWYSDMPLDPLPFLKMGY
ncbi:MAG: M23/M56 family metallopeptidase [Clostridia bacterium]|nr:M23/M56 family metallopeptidase [Clostridia bacterium]